MRNDKEKAIELRKLGKSYKQIKAELQIPLGTLSEWFSGEDWSERIKKKLVETSKVTSTARLVALDKIRGQHLERVYAEAREEAKAELETLKYNPLFIAGLMLYWGEGDRKTKQQVRLNNSDPELIRLFVVFLENVCRIPSEKIRANVLIYPDIDEASNRRFWSFASGISLGRFTKSIRIQGRHKTARLRYGVCNIVVSSTYFKVKMMEWLKLLPKELMNKGYYESM